MGRTSRQANGSAPPIRRCLLPQTGGFEGFGGVAEVLHPDDPAVLELIEQSHMQLDWRAARLSGGVLVEHGDDAVIARVDHTLQVDGPFEILGPGAHELDKTLAPSVDGPETWGVSSRDPFGIGCEEFGVEDRASIAPRQASLELVDSPAHDLHVLLRHGLRPAPKSLHHTLDSPWAEVRWQSSDRLDMPPPIGGARLDTDANMRSCGATSAAASVHGGPIRSKVELGGPAMTAGRRLRPTTGKRYSSA